MLCLFGVLLGHRSLDAHEFSKACLVYSGKQMRIHRTFRRSSRRTARNIKTLGRGKSW